MPTNYLPVLNENTGIEFVPQKEIGVFQHLPAQSQLPGLAKKISVQPGVTQIHSIPNPWARVILFGRALFDGKHTLHAKVLGEWRGLLAILGLKDIRRFSELSSTPVDLSAGDEAPGGFLSTIERMKPSAKESFAEGATWDRFHILRWCGSECKGEHRAFGVTSPATLVATGAYYADVFSPEEVPWFVDGSLRDPITPLGEEEEPPGDLSKAERKALAEWVMYVRSTLHKVADESLERHAQLLECLEAYAGELFEGVKAPDAKDVLSDVGIGLLEPELYSCLDKARKPAVQTLTDLEIVTDRPLTKRYILYDQNLAKKFNPARKDREVTVFETVTLASAPRHLTGLSSKSSGLLKNDKNNGEIYWCKPDFFFQDDLIYEQLSEDNTDGSTFPGCRPVNASGRAERRHIALPLTEEAAQLFTPAYLEENFFIDWLPVGGARCRLRLNVRTVGKEPGPVNQVEIEHVYGEKDLNKIRTLPLVCIWPNFRFPDEPQNEALLPEQDHGFRNRWKRYYIFEAWLGSAKAEELVVTPLDKTGFKQHLFAQKPLFQITATSRFPEVLVCQMPYTDKKPKLNDTQPPKGLLLPHIDPTPPENHGPRKALGVDFGTTGTSIYHANVVGAGIEERTEGPVAMSSPGRIFQVTAFPPSELKDLTRHHFIPSRIKALGRILSVFQALAGQGGRREIFDGHVLFQDSGSIGSFVWGQPELVRTNLKWGDQTAEADAAEAFLSQICTQSLAELIFGGASSVDVRYSYPTAFDDADRQRIRGIWADVLREAQGATSVPITPNAGNADNYEAVAAARFFATSGDLHITGGAVTLDIGGGTTDIAVWNQTKGSPALIAHSSFLFAGTDMFQAALRKRLNLLRRIDKSFPTPELDSQRFPAAYHAAVDALIAVHGDTLLGRLPRASAENEAVRQFTAILELGMSGIAFYAGLVLGNLVQSGAYDTSSSLIQVFVGGNASRLLHWCDLGKFEQGTTFYKKFCGCVLGAARIGAPEILNGKSLEVTISPKPKEEVAYGLVATYLSTEKMSDEANQLAGESFDIGVPELRPWSDSPDIQSFLAGNVRVARDLPMFSNFLSLVGDEMTEIEKQKIVSAINDTLQKMSQFARKLSTDPKFAKEMKGGKLNPVRKQPLFIVALKELIKMRIDRLVQSE